MTDAELKDLAARDFGCQMAPTNVRAEIAETVDEVGVEGARQTNGPLGVKHGEPVRVFYSYSHKDENLRSEHSNVKGLLNHGTIE